MLDLRHENSVEYNRKIKAMAESLGFSVSDYLGFLALIFSGQALYQNILPHFFCTEDWEVWFLKILK